MPTLISGPAGSGKTALAREMVDDGRADLALDFQSLLAALLLLQRGPDGRYPQRDGRAERLLPLAETLRRTVLREAIDRGLNPVMTNSDGSPSRRSEILTALGPNSVEVVVDPGRAIVEARLADPITGVLSGQCGQAIGRYYDRL